MTKIQFAIGAGSEHFGIQTEYLLNSIRRFADVDYGITIFLPRSEKPNLSPKTIEAFESSGELVVGEFPIQDHPMSAKQAALRAAERQSADWHILLDTDTLVLGSLKELLGYHDSDAGLMLCPEHGGWPYWARLAAADDWEKIYGLIHAEFPGYVMNASFDGTRIPPYWNGGVVITNRPIADEWLDHITELRDLFGPDLFYAEQLALSLLGHRYGVSRLPYRYNYPYYMHLRCPSDRKIIHYDSLWHLARIVNPNTTSKLEDIGVYECDEVPKGIHRLKAIGKGVGVRAYREVVRKWYPNLRDRFHRA